MGNRGETAEHLLRLGEDLRVAAGAVLAVSVELVEMAEGFVVGEPVEWVPPIGTDEYPPEAWYVATLHDPIGQAINSGWYSTHGHTGIDLNLDRWPWGDVERGAPVYAVARGEVISRGSSAGWLGSCVVRHDYDGGYLFVRYAHLDPDRVPVGVGDIVLPGMVLGFLGDYRRGGGGDHLHFDMAVSGFNWDWWLTPKTAWVDPLPIMRARLGVELVDRMVGRGDG